MGYEDPVFKKMIFELLVSRKWPSKMAKMAKFGNFEYLARYPIRVSIKRTLTGKLVLEGQNLI